MCVLHVVVVVVTIVVVPSSVVVVAVVAIGRNAKRRQPFTWANSVKVAQHRFATHPQPLPPNPSPFSRLWVEWAWLGTCLLRQNFQ